MPVCIITDGYLANGSEPWKIPDHEGFEKIVVEHPTDPDGFQPYSRDENLARPWAIPGTKGMRHRIGGLEKQHITGNVSYDFENHQLMTVLRKERVDRVAQFVPPQEVEGDDSGELLLLGWGGTYGSIHTAMMRAREKGQSVSAAHLRHLHPMPSNLGEVLKNFKRVLVPELNMGQLRLLIRGKYLVDARGLNKMQGKPFLVEELEQAIDLMLADGFGDREFLVPRHHRVSLDEQEYVFFEPQELEAQ